MNEDEFLRRVEEIREEMSSPALSLFRGIVWADVVADIEAYERVRQERARWLRLPSPTSSS